MPSIFTKIMKGEIPSYKVYEDEHVFAFLDIFPVKLGHTLVVPKVEIDYFVDVPEPHYSAVFIAAKKLAPAILDFGAKESPKPEALAAMQKQILGYL